MALRACRYVRVSSDEGIADSFSPEAQRSTIEAYCHNQGWEIVADYQDIGISGWTGTTLYSTPGCPPCDILTFRQKRGKLVALRDTGYRFSNYPSVAAMPVSLSKHRRGGRGVCTLEARHEGNTLDSRIRGPG